MNNKIVKVLVFSASLTMTSVALAQTKVVVVPMAGDTEYIEIDTFDRTIIVGGSGTDAENGTALLDALALATSPSASSPWLILVEPGVFDLAESELELPAYVSLRGSGVDVTTITAIGTTGSHRAIELLGNNMLSHLTIKDSSTGTSSGAVVPTGNDVRIEHIKVVADDEDGIRVDNFADNVAIAHVEVTAADRALTAQSGNVGVEARNSVFASTGDNVLNVGSSSTVKIFHSELNSIAPSKQIINLLGGDLEIGFSKLSSTSTSTINTAAPGTGDFFIYHSYVNTGATYSFTGNSDTCLATTTTANFLATTCQ